MSGPWAKMGDMGCTASSILGSCVALALVTGCSSEDPGLSVLTDSSATASTVSAEIRGELGIDDEGCIRIGADYAVWPQGTRRVEGGVEVGERLFIFGDDITGSGGYLDQEPAGQFMGLDDAYEMARCTDPADQVVVLTVVA